MNSHGISPCSADYLVCNMRKALDYEESVAQGRMLGLVVFFFFIAFAMVWVTGNG